MPALPLVPSDEEAMLREAVFGIASGFGHSYFAEVSRRGEAPHELWQALSEGGFTGVLSVEHEDPVWSGTEDKVKQGLDIAYQTLRPLIIA